MLHAQILRASCAACALLALSIPHAHAQQATPLPAVTVDTDRQDGNGFCSVPVSQDAIRSKASSTDDTARLLSGVPGVSLNAGGGLSSLPSIHGLADDRIKTLVDGIPVTSSCPNHMNPPLSYIAPTTVGKVQAMAGITPVSAGGDSIGGTIAVESKAPVFATPGERLHTEGSASLAFRSNNSALSAAVEGWAATDWASIGVTLSRAEAMNYHNGDGDAVHGSQYKNWGGDGTVAVQGGGRKLVLRAGDSYSPYEGFPNQVMDMVYNNSPHAEARLTGDFSWGSLDVNTYWRDVYHKMNFLFGNSNAVIPAGGGMPMFDHGQDIGYSIKAELPLNDGDILRIGNEYSRYTLNEWWPPVSSSGAMGPNTFQNIAGGERDRIGTYAEWERTWDPQWTSLLGLRNDTVLMTTGNIQGYNSTSQNYGVDASTFNAAKHHKADVNFDVTALARYEASPTHADEFGYARKSRSPNLFERYAWASGSMPASMIGWFGDYNSYVGNLSLRPETANTFSATATWHDAEKADWEIKLTPYYTYINDYIGVDRLRYFNGHTVTGGKTLQFTNHDAQIFGSDLSGKKALAKDTGIGDFDITGILGWTRGLQVNTGKSLYHVMPINGQITLGHSLDSWTNALEIKAVGRKAQVDSLRFEPNTPGYAVVNLRTSYVWESLTLTGGIENLFDQQYYDPLGGVAYKDYRYTGQGSARAPLSAMGRSFDVGFSVKF